MCPLPAMWSSWFFGRIDSTCFSLAVSRTFFFGETFLRAHFTTHRCFHRYLQLVPCVSHGFLVLSIFWIDELNASQSSSIIDLWFFSSPYACFSFFCAAFDLPDYIWGLKESGLVVAWISVSRSPDHISPSGGFCVQEYELCESCPWTWQTSIHIDNPVVVNAASRFVCVVLVTSMYFSGIGNVSSFCT